MGIISSVLQQQNNTHSLTMKSFLFAMACAEPEAKPWLGYGYSGVYGSYAPAVYGAGVYGAYPYATAYHYGKREAEADAEAKPWLAYGYNYAAAPYAGVYGGVYGAYPYTYAHYGKREAEAEADPALLYNAEYMGGGYAPAVYGAYHGVYNTAFPYRGYAIGKREAEADAEADPALLYSGAYPFAHSAYSYGYPSVYSGFHYGKREAEAEPQYFGRYGYRYGGSRGVYRPRAYGYRAGYYY